MQRSFPDVHFRNPWDIIKADSVRIPFIEKASMAVDCFVGCIRCSGRICYHDFRYLVRTIFPPNHYSHCILCAAGGSLQTSKISNLPLGDNGVPFRLTVSDLSYILRISSIYAPIYYWSGLSLSVGCLQKCPNLWLIRGKLTP